MADFFVYGTLCHLPLLDCVLGRPAVPEPAVLCDHAVYWAEDESFPLIVSEPGGVAPGLVLRDLTGDEAARLDFYEGGFAYRTREVVLAGNALPVRVYFPDPGIWRPGARWALSDWVARYGATVTATAADFMSLYGEKPATEVQRRYPQMLARGASRVRAGSEPAPTTLRRQPAPVEVLERRQPYARFFAVEEYDLRVPLFRGGAGPEVRRAVLVSTDAATVLPYDPARDRVLVVEQFRPAPFARGDANPWCLEAIAGRIDPWETPAEAARREAAEEAGLALTGLIPVANYYPSPGAKTEYLYSFVALADLPDHGPRIGGLEAEDEDIRAHVIPFARLMDLIGSGEVTNGPLILTALWLESRRDGFRAGV